LRKRRPEISAGHGVISGCRAWFARELIIGRQSRADGAAGVSGRRLHPDIPERLLAQNFAVGDAVERDAAGQAKIFRSALARKAARQPQHDLFSHLLHGGGEIHVTLLQSFRRIARLAAEQRVEPAVGRSGRCSSRSNRGRAGSCRLP
jgi:hypothetical protein